MYKPFKINQECVKIIDHKSHVNPFINDLGYQLAMYNRLDFSNENYIRFEDDIDDVKVGIIGDVHQNSKLLSDTLDYYRDHNVEVGLFLGDYSFIPGHLGRKDPAEIRFVQFKKSIGLIINWVNEDEKRHATIILGNHEIDSSYFVGGKKSTSYNKIAKYFHSIIKSNDRIFGHSKPFYSFEYENAVDVVVQGSGIGTRSFRLAHAISDSFVMSMYMGLRDDPIKSKQQLLNLESKIGPLWLESIKPRIGNAKVLWKKFVKSDFDINTIEEISSNVASALNVNFNLEELTKVDNKWSERIDLYLNKYAYDYEFLSQYFDSFFMKGNDFRHLGHEFAYALRTMHRILGATGMITYNVIGHFHIDLGIIETSREFQSNLIGVSGFQPNKIIADSFSSYIVHLTPNRVDKIYKLSVDHVSDFENPFECDLSFGEWKDKISWPLQKDE